MTTHLTIDSIDHQAFLALRIAGANHPPRTLCYGPYPDPKAALADYQWADAALDAGDVPSLPWQEAEVGPQILEGHIERLHPPRRPQVQRWSVVPTPERTLWNIEDEAPDEEAVEAIRKSLRRDQISLDWLRCYLDLFEDDPSFSIRAIAPDGSVWISPTSFESREAAEAELGAVRGATREWDRSDFLAEGWSFQNRMRDDKPFTFVRVRGLDGRLFNVAIWDLEHWGLHWLESPAEGPPRYLGLAKGQPVRWQVRYSPYRDRDQWTLTAMH